MNIPLIPDLTNPKWLISQEILKSIDSNRGDLQLKTPFKSFFQFLNPANASIHRSMPSLVYVPLKPFQNCLIRFSISAKSRSIELLGPKDTTVYRSKPALSRAHGYHDPPSMNILGSFPLRPST
jgi:hypothetical protein